MPLARINNHLLHFVHIPKTGGSCVTDYMRGKGRIALYSRKNLRWTQTTPQHMENDVTSVLVPDGFSDASFAIMRNPLERLLSEYRYRATRHNGCQKTINSISAPDKLSVELDWNEQFHGTFEEWVKLVFERYAADPNTCDNHIRPQVDFLGRKTEVFLFERGLERVFRWIDKITGTGKLDITLDRNQSASFSIEVPDITRRKIEKFYGSDYEAIDKIRATSSFN